MKRKNVILGAAVLLAIGFLLGGYVLFGRFGSSQNSNAVNQLQTDEKPQFVVALGRLEPADKVIKLTAPQSNGGGNPRLAKLLVNEGEEISEGQIIAELDGKEKQRATVSEANEYVKIAESKLAQVRAGVKQGDLEAQAANIQRLKAEIQKAETELNRTKSRGKNATTEVLTISKLVTDLRKAQIELNRTKFPTAQGIVPAPEYVAIKRLEPDLANAEIELRRAENLFASGDIAKSTLDARRTTVKTLKLEIERAEATLKTVTDERQLAVDSLNREIERANATLQTTTDNRSLSVVTLNRELERAEASYASLAEIRPTDIDAAEAEVERAKASLETAKVILNDLDVKALSDGKVLKIRTRAGETISGDGIIEIGETSQMYVVAEVFEEDIAKIKRNQNAELTIRSTNEKLSGEVAEIGSKIGKRSLLDTDPIADVDARVVEVRVKLSKSESKKVENLTNLRLDVRINVS